MEFKISFDACSELFMMNGYAERCIMDHLQNIAKVYGIIEVLYTLNEDRALGILSDNNIKVTLDFEY